MHFMWVGSSIVLGRMEKYLLKIRVCMMKNNGNMKKKKDENIKSAQKCLPISIREVIGLTIFQRFN